MTGGAPAAQEPRLHLAHKADQPRGQQQDQQHLQPLDDEIADQSHMRQHQEQQHEREEDQAQIAPDGQELEQVQPVRGIVHRAQDRCVDPVPDGIAKLDAERSRLEWRRAAA